MAIEAVYFSSLKPGARFTWRTGEMVRTRDMGLMGRSNNLPHSGAGSSFNCISMEDGEPHHVDGEELVIPGWDH